MLPLSLLPSFSTFAEYPLPTDRVNPSSSSYRPGQEGGGRPARRNRTRACTGRRVPCARVTQSLARRGTARSEAVALRGSPRGPWEMRSWSRTGAWADRRKFLHRPDLISALLYIAKRRDLRRDVCYYNVAGANVGRANLRTIFARYVYPHLK